MNKDQVKGRVEQAKGTVKEQAGKAVGNPNLRDEGTVDKAAGKAQETYGDAKEKIKDAVDKALTARTGRADAETTAARHRRQRGATCAAAFSFARSSLPDPLPDRAPPALKPTASERARRRRRWRALPRPSRRRVLRPSARHARTSRAAAAAESG